MSGDLSPDQTLIRLTRWALALTAAATPLYIVRWHYGPIPTTLLETLVLLTILLYVATVVRNRGPLPGRTGLEIPIALFLVAGAIGVLVAPDHRGALGIFRAYLIEPVAIFYVVVAVIDSAAAIDLVLAAWAVGSVLFCAVDLLYFGRAVVGHSLVAGHAAAAFNLDSNAVALYLEPLIGLAAGFVLMGRGRQRWAAIGVLIVMLAAELATLSRGGLLALAALVLIALAGGLPARTRIGLAAAALVAGLVIWRLPVIGPRIGHALDPRTGTFDVRGQIWAATARMLRDHPIFGAGVNAYQSTMTKYIAHNPYLVPEPYPHNIFLTSWTELGLLGLFSFTYILVALIVQPWRAFRRAAGVNRPLLWGTAAAFVMVLVHGLVDSPYWKNDLSVEFWILAALEIVALRGARNDQRTEPQLSV
ncbi:MAG TPA: O-antigen ligase family protein [Candidatus Dormibacteraeota bacterium]